LSSFDGGAGGDALSCWRCGEDAGSTETCQSCGASVGLVDDVREQPGIIRQPPGRSPSSESQAPNTNEIYWGCLWPVLGLVAMLAGAVWVGSWDEGWRMGVYLFLSSGVFVIFAYGDW
jgi:hypothetical protein